MIPRMPLDDPPLLTNLFLEDPAPLVAALSAVAVVLIVLGQRRLRPPLIRVGVVAALLAALVWAISATLATPRERLISSCHRLIAATVMPAAPLSRSDQSLAVARSLMTEQTTLTDAPGQRQFNLERILQELRYVLDQYPVEHHRIRRLAAQVDGHQGQTWFRVSTTLRDFGPVQTTWLIQWRLGDDEQWRMMTIQC